MRIATVITLNAADRKVLQGWARGWSTPVRLVLRAKIILQAEQGIQNDRIARELGTNRLLVGRWRNRFVKLGLAGIEKDAPRGGRKPKIREAITTKILAWTTQRKPNNATHWSTRMLAKALGSTHSMVHRVWKANGLKPHLSRTFKVSNDDRFEENLNDVVGLYLNSSDHAWVLSVDEKSQIQVLDRTQPGHPFKKGRCGTFTHDYKRNGTTTLFAALNMLDGTVIGDCKPHHRHQEWLQFLKRIDQQVPATLALHLIADNYATHKHPKVQSWLKRHPRFHMHFTPTSSSWFGTCQ